MNNRRHTVALETTLLSIDTQRRKLITDQETDNRNLRAGLLSAAEFLSRWSRRQQQRINLETRDFWLRCQLEELCTPTK